MFASVEMPCMDLCLLHLRPQRAMHACKEPRRPRSRMDSHGTYLRYERSRRMSKLPAPPLLDVPSLLALPQDRSDQRSTRFGEIGAG